MVAFAFEVPSGALADAWSRRRLYAIGEVLTAAGYALWLIWPTFTGFALGFVLWGLGGSLSSGSLEALLYDELDAEGRSADYARIAGRGGTVAILAMLAATLLATPAFAAGGYLLVGVVSIATVTLGGLLALGLPESGRTPPGGDDGDGGYLALLRSGVRDATRNRRVLRAVAIAALLPGFSALDEYLPLLAREKGAPTVAVPLVYAVTALAMAAGSSLAGRESAARPVLLPVATAMAAALLAAGALVPPLAGMVAVSAAFGLLQFGMVRAETRLQDEITGRARSTVLSVSGFAAEVFAVGLYAWFALALPLPVLFAMCALPLLLTALLAGPRSPGRNSPAKDEGPGPADPDDGTQSSPRSPT
ncbi:MFS transporter [Paractinoplanes rishiriensis]|uniref:MFS transporter n=1 Tax=Paractinoplanes rishiriensis TaxID=1050105 RepID=A0A919K7G1_9ACTN|nr:MFS transporter [Actinoplanes rishiriensis]